MQIYSISYLCSVIYPDNFESKTGFDKIRTMISGLCLSRAGKRYVEKTGFSTDYKQIKKLLDQTSEFRLLLLEEQGFPAKDYFDLSEELYRLRTEGSYIEQEKLFDLKTSLEVIIDILRFFRNVKTTKYPNLTGMASGIYIEPAVTAKIANIIDDRGEIKDTASSKLSEIRKSIAKEEASVNGKIKRLLNQAKQAGWTESDAEATIRDGRPVIPVATSYKRALKGFIRDESATGQTVYIEPEETAEVYNRLRELQNAERREIIKILKDFSDFIRPEIPGLIKAYKFLGVIDFIRAKALFALQINAVKPVLNNKPGLKWNKAVHPLLLLSHKKQNKPVVPLNIELNHKNRILVISGPNAGGKSVCLTTVGLLQYMLQCGLLIPVRDDSETGLFKKLFIDIGDEQSLENDLSTYSSHLLNMKYFLNNASPDTLFLIDEFGTGTEPQLGGAIAEAVLEKLNGKKAFGVVTTHYSNLKLMARKGNGIINGAMLFDTKAMQPLFILKTGKPGSSFAFEIARKIGFPNDVLKIAQDKTGKKQLDFDEQLQQLDIERKELEKKKQQFQVADNLLNEMISKYERLLKELNLKKQEIIEKARDEAGEIIARSNKLIENTIKQIKEAQAEKEKTKKIRKELIKKSVEVLTPKTKQPETEKKNNKQKAAAPKPAKPFRKGDTVVIKEQGVPAEIIALKGEEVVLSFNSVTLKTTLDKIEYTAKKDIPVYRPAQSTKHAGIAEKIQEKAANFKLQIDVRGKRGDEAIDTVKQYIDDAIILNISEVKILHGKGYGILRSLIHDYLATIPEVKNFKDEHIERGGHGITVVTFK